MQEILFEVFSYSLSVLLIIVLPVLLATVLTSTVAAVFQAATTIHEPVILYAVRLGSFLLVAYFMYPTWSAAMQRLALLAFQ